MSARRSNWTNVSRRTPNGWQRRELDLAKIGELVEAADCHLAIGPPVEAAVWGDRDGNVRRFEIAYENGALFICRIDRKGRQSFEERLSVSAEAPAA